MSEEGSAIKAGIEELVRRAEGGDAAALAALRGLVAPDAPLWLEAGDLAAQAEEGLVRRAAGADLVLAEALRLRVAALKEELAGPGAGPLERLLAAQAALSWLQALYLDALEAQAGAASPAHMAELRRRQSAAHRRHVQAARALVTARKHLGRRERGEDGSGAGR